MTTIDGTPSGVVVSLEYLLAGVFTWIALDGVATPDVGGPIFIDRFTPNRQGALANRASTFSFTAHQPNGGGSQIHDWMRVKAVDSTSGTEYYYAGYTQINKSYRVGANEKIWEIQCVSPELALTKGQKTITNKIHIPAGQTDVMILGGGTWVVSAWAALTVYTQAQTVKPTTSPVYYYECAGAGAHPFDHTTHRIYKLGKGVTPSSPGTNPNAWYELTTASGAYSDTEPNWNLAPALGNTVTETGHGAGNVWTNRGDPAVPKSGNIEPGHSGADAWPVVVGQTLAWGNTTWRCMGTLAWGGLMPTYAPEFTNLGLNNYITSSISFDWQDMTVKDALDALRSSASSSQNISYTCWVDGSGNWAFTWFDFNDASITPVTTTFLTDATGNPANGAHYDKFERTIDGQKVANYFAVSGDPNTFAYWYVDGSIAAQPFLPSAVNTGTDTITITAHGFSNGTPLYFFNPVLTAGDGLPSPLIENSATLPAVNYYAHRVDANNFQVSTDPLGVGSIIDITTQGVAAGGAFHYVALDPHFDYYANLSYQYYGRLITTKTISAGSLETNRDCRSRCKQYSRAYYKARDTLDVGGFNWSVDGLGLPIPRKIKVTNAMEGLSLTPYAIVRENLTFDGQSGIAYRELNLGDAFEDNQDTGIIPGLGVGFVFDDVAPAPPTWPDQPVIENQWFPDNYVRAHVMWNPNTEGDLFQYQVRTTQAGVVIGLDFVIEPVVDLVLPRLQPSQTILVEVRAQDTSGNWSNAFNTLWPNITFTSDQFHPWPGIYNGDFEIVKPGQPTLPDGWDIFLSGTASASLDPASNTGLYCLALKTTSMSNYSAASCFYGQAIAGHTYRLEFAENWDVAITKNHTVYWYDNTLTLLSSSVFDSGSGSPISYRGRNVFFTAPANAAAFRIQFYVTSFAGPTAVYRVDTVAIRDTAYRPLQVQTQYSADTNLGVIDHAVGVSASAANRTITLPDATIGDHQGREYIVKKTDNTSHTVTLATTGGQTIDGASTYVLSNQYDAVVLHSDGSNWQVASQSDALINTGKGLITLNGKTRLGDTSSPTANAHIKAGTASANTAPLKMDSGTVLTTPEVGAMEYDGSAFYLTPVVDRRSIQTDSAPITGTTTVANTVTETVIWTGSISANELVLGKAIRALIFGRFSTANGTDTFTWRIRTGGLTGTVLHAASSTVGSVTNAPMFFEQLLTVRSIGGSGTIWTYNMPRLNNTIKDGADTATTTVDTTVARDLVLTIQWSNALAGNTASVDQGWMEYIRG